MSPDFQGFLYAMGVIAAGCFAIWLSIRDLLKY